MSRIADKHGLTNKYREVGSFKRVVKRGRPRKYLFGPPKRSKRIAHSTNKTNVNLDLHTPTTKEALGCVGCGTILLLVFVIFCIIIGTSSCSSSKSEKGNIPIEFSLSQYCETDIEVEIGRYDTATFDLQPFEVTDEDLEIVNSNNEIAECTFYTNSVAGGKIAVINIKGISAGNSTVYLKDKNSESKSCSINITVPKEEIDNSRTVYLNLNGDKYHYNVNCAGKSARKTTLNKVIKYKEPCSKCVY